MSVTLITGCSSGFGLGAAVALAKRGGTVVATTRNTAKAGPLREAATTPNPRLRYLVKASPSPLPFETIVMEKERFDEGRRSAG